MWLVPMTVVCAMVMMMTGETEARKQSPLLVEEGGRGRSRSAECQFGKQLRELGSTWFADLGPPFGVMYCIKCQCVPFQKKRRIVARVQCKNIKNDCPKPACEEPVLLPGRCCKTCPEYHGFSPDIAQDVAPVMTAEEEEKNMKHFAAILTGRTSLVLHRDDAVISSTPVNQQESHVATGRFTFHRKHLYYSFYTSAPTRPKSLQFVDYQGNILEEQALGVETPYQNATGKVCGVWRRVAQSYRKLLREEKVYATLVWQDEVGLSGPVARYRALSTELFSALLEVGVGADRGAMRGAGGTAVVTVSSSAPSIHVALVFNGVFGQSETHDVALMVRLETVDKQTPLLEEVVKVSKPAYEVNEVEFKSAVSAADLRQLTRGKLRLVVANKNSPDDLRLEGRIQTRTTCEVFQSLVSVSDADVDESESATSVSASAQPASGLGLFYVNRDGALVYNVQLDSLSAEPAPLLALVSGRGRRRVELEDLTPSLSASYTHAVGQVDRLTPRELEQLYAGDLALNVATERCASVVRGRLAARPVADARDSAAPVLMMRKEGGGAAVSGLAWMAVDMECTLHYEVILSGLGDEKRILELYLIEELPIVAVNAPVSRRLLEEFYGHQLEGFVHGMTQTELARIESMLVSLEVRDQAAGKPVLRARMNKIFVPTSCRPHITDNTVPAAPATATGDNDAGAAMPCYADQRFHEDGAQWRAHGDPCAMCHCRGGRVRCDAMTCPALRCERRESVAGECCPVCAPDLPAPVNSTSSRGCHLGGDFHAAGSSWHPYLPPHGFDECTVCTCDASQLSVGCQRQRCPMLACDEATAFKTDRRACCKQCPEPPPAIPREMGMAREQAGTSGLANRTPEEQKAAGGCEGLGEVFENGKDWHPRVLPHGENRCVRCFCKDGKMDCRRNPKLCSRAACRKDPLAGQCCPQCRRKVRHHKEQPYS